MHTSLFEEIISLENLLVAWTEFKRGKTRKRETQQFQFYLEDNLLSLHQSLADRSYTHGNYEAFYVYDPKRRHIHKAQIRDRIVHQALVRIVYHLFDRRFIFDSYSCRIDKGTHAAVHRLEQFTRRATHNYTRKIFSLKCDVKRFFANIDQDILFSLIKETIEDKDTLWLIQQIIASFAEAPGKGLPLGNVTSQLFGNIYLNELDQFVKHTLKERYYIRYCDDFVILHESSTHLENLVSLISHFLENNLHITLHPDKIIIRPLQQGLDFLGYVTLPYYRVIRTKTKRRMLRLVSEKNIHSYLGVCRHAHARSLEREIQQKISG